jgi:putative FmdB family regulatory protein
MPLYEFDCPSCGNIQEEAYRIADCPNKVECDQCGKWAVKVIAVGHGGIQEDSDVPWLESAIMTLQPEHEKPIETRGEYKRYLKERNIIACG